MKGICRFCIGSNTVMQNRRTAGVLMHLTSLNGPFGIGVMGKEAFDFAGKLSDMGFRYWQVLPLVPCDGSGSPYCSVSAFAGNVSLIDPRLLEKDGLLTKEEVSQNEIDSTYKACHALSLEKRLQSLRLAFSRLRSEEKETLKVFESQNEWVRDYAYFMALKSHHNGKPWWEWEKKYSAYSSALLYRQEFEEEIQFHIFTQFVFFSQWRTLKEYANAKGVFIIGDMPVYVSRDSVDVWSGVSLFEFDEDTLTPKEVAGVPPDYFSQDGQLWGNPLYNWEKMEKDGFRWWIARLRFALKLYDKVRIDHFRAFASYWAVPAESQTAKIGRWKKGPGMKLFSAVKQQLENADIIAEDLGTFGQDVLDLLSESGFPGMRVIQFGFDPNGDSTHLPHNYDKNCVAYVGTHDNNTILGWLWDASESERAFALRYCCFGGTNWGEGGAHSGSCRAIIESVWRSAADTAILCVQDMCGYGKDARMNIPGTTEENWGFRISEEGLASIDEAYFKEINSLYRRTYLPK